MLHIQEIVELLEAKPSGAGWLARCPAHFDKTPSLSFRAGHTVPLIVKCFAGCSHAEIFSAIAELGGISVEQSWFDEPMTVPINGNAEKIKLANGFWQSSRKVVDGDLVQRYFLNRGLQTKVIPECIRFRPRCRISGITGLEFLPAVVVRIDSPEGLISTCLRIYLTKDGCKANFPNPKRLLSSPAKGSAIRLGLPTKELGICEGLETGLAIQNDTDLPVWCSSSAATMPTLQIPRRVERVFIFADHDNAGLRAAEQLAARLNVSGIITQVLVPLVAGNDWLDELLR
jgi:hypothetical protein